MARENEYDNANRLRIVTQSYHEPICKYSLEYDKNADGEILPENTISKITLEGIYEKTFDKDEYQRLEKETTKTSSNVTLSKEFTYLEVADGTNTRLTSLVDSVKSKVGDTVTGNLKYTYDNNGNITVITDISGTTPEVLCEYYYDGLNRLIRENNSLRDRTYTYNYDKAGNIKQKANHSFALGNNIEDIVLPKNIYTYYYATTGWKDKLVSIEDDWNGTTKTITYDAVGNPLTYLGHTLEWTDVRRLKKFDNISFAYNANGIRTEKGGNTFYELNSDNILMETRYEMGSNGAPICHNFIYHYDNSGICGFSYKGQNYYFLKNLQGDVTEIYLQDGTLVGQYIYDAWGNHTITLDVDGIASLNPIRYRSYYYDVETGLYYLKTRYYDPTTGRFISPDSYVSTGQDLDGFNMYAYCGNNPIVNTDSFGTRHVKGIDACGGAGSSGIKPLVTSNTLSPNKQELQRLNYENNKILDGFASSTKNQMIKNQYDGYIKKFQYGRRDAEYNGCEAIAIHNAKVMKGIDSTLTETIVDLQNANAMWESGEFGTKPSKIGEVLDSYGITNYELEPPNNMTMYGTYIVSYVTSSVQIHTVFVLHTPDGYKAYNYARGENWFDPTSKYIICGYYLE